MSTEQSPARKFFRRLGRGLAILGGIGLGGWACFAIGTAIGLAGVAAFACGLGVVVGGVIALNCIGYGIYKLVEYVRNKRVTTSLVYPPERSHDRSSTSNIISRTQDEFGPAEELRAKRGATACPAAAPLNPQVKKPSRIAKFFARLFCGSTEQQDQADLSAGNTPGSHSPTLR